MMLGLSLSAFTTLHVVISLIAIGSGLVVMIGLLRNDRMDGWTALFLATTIATSVTGFMFPFNGFLPSHAFGVISLVLLAAAVMGRYVLGYRGAWRWIYVAGAVVSLYLNVFVLVVQGFQKVAVLNALAPTQSEPPFAIAQGIVFVVFVALTWIAIRRFRPTLVAI